jgi:methyl-accepting chemotaxis protein
MHLTADELTKANESRSEVVGILDAMADAVKRANDQVVQIASSVEEQATAAEEVANNIEDTAFISRSTRFMADVVLKGTDKICYCR